MKMFAPNSASDADFLTSILLEGSHTKSPLRAAKEKTMTKILSRGFAWGGPVAFLEATKLWAGCAIGGANSSGLWNEIDKYVALKAAHAAFVATAEAIAAGWENQEWLAGKQELLAQKANDLLDVCEDIEGRSMTACACVNKEEDPYLLLEWEGTWTKGRMIIVEICLEVSTPHLALKWDTGTGKESTRLNLPSQTNEADKPEAERRHGGWNHREEMLVPAADAA